MGRRKNGRIDPAGRQRCQPGGSIAADHDVDFLALQPPFFNGELERQIIGATEVEDAEFFSREILGGLNLGLGDDGIGKFIVRGGDHDDVRASGRGHQGRRGGAGADLSAASEQGGDRARASRDHDQVDVEAEFIEQSEVLGDPDRALKSRQAAKIRDDLLRSARERGESQ